MLKYILFISFWIFTKSFIFSQIELKKNCCFGDNPGNLRMYYYAPEKNTNKNSKSSIVVALHGCNQNSKSLAEQSDWNKIAKANNFLVIYPEQKRINNGSNCFNWFLKKDNSYNNGESMSIKNMIQYAIDSLNGNANSIFIYGLSAGAAMGVNMLVNYPSTFLSGAIFAGVPYGIASSKKEALAAMLIVKDKTPLEWRSKLDFDSLQISIPNIIICHGNEDKIVNIKNSYGLIEQWTSINNIDTIPDSKINDFSENQNICRVSYINQEGKEKVIFYKFNGLGHSLPVNPGNGKLQGGKIGLFSKDIDFFSTYYIAIEFGLINPK